MTAKGEDDKIRREADCMIRKNINVRGRIRSEAADEIWAEVDVRIRAGRLRRVADERATQ